MQNGIDENTYKKSEYRQLHNGQVFPGKINSSLINDTSIQIYRTFHEKLQIFR